MAKVEVRNALSFMFAGRAEFTIENIDSGNSYKYRVTRSNKNEKMYYVRVKRGADWVYAGYLLKDGFATYYRQGKNGNIDIQDPAIRGILYAIKFGEGNLPRPMLMYHHGKCGCCGRSLDDNISIERGFGPVCWDRLTKTQKRTIEEKLIETSLF